MSGYRKGEVLAIRTRSDTRHYTVVSTSSHRVTLKGERNAERVLVTGGDGAVSLWSYGNKPRSRPVLDVQVVDVFEGAEACEPADIPAPHRDLEYQRAVRSAAIEVTGGSALADLGLPAALEVRRPVADPIPMLLWCPGCGERHIDEGEFAIKVHHTHACQACGLVWRPAIVPTFGVQFLPGFLNESASP